MGKFPTDVMYLDFAKTFYIVRHALLVLNYNSLG